MECTFKLFWVHPFGQVLFSRKEGLPDDSGWVTASIRVDGNVFHSDMQVSLEDVSSDSVFPALGLLCQMMGVSPDPEVVVKASMDSLDEALMLSAAIVAASEMDFDIFEEDENGE